MSHRILIAGLVVGALLAPRPALGLTVSGVLSPEYGAPLATQSTQTSFYDTPADHSIELGSELDAAYGFISDGVLYLFLAGNVGFCCATNFSHQEQVEIFIDSRSGEGQNVLRGDSGSGSQFYMAGLTFDPEFAPDYWLETTLHTVTWYAELPTSGAGAGYSLGYNYGTTPGTLVGGTNPYDIRAALDNSNAAGVTHGCGAATGSGVGTGLELAIPLAAIGNPTGCINVSAFVTTQRGVNVGNQALGSMPAGSCSTIPSGTVDFGRIAGAQYFSVCDGATPALPTTWGAFKLIYR
jgi:hypothetical protein